MWIELTQAIVMGVVAALVYDQVLSSRINKKVDHLEEKVNDRVNALWVKNDTLSKLSKLCQVS